MARKGKYPTPEEATNNYLTGVNASKDLWVNRCQQGSLLYRTWYSGFASVVYPIVAGLPEKTGDVSRDVMNRVVPVANAIKSLAISYRNTKIQGVVSRVQKVVPVVR